MKLFGNPLNHWDSVFKLTKKQMKAQPMRTEMLSLTTLTTWLFLLWSREIRSFRGAARAVDCKKKELIGNFKNNGEEWTIKKEPIVVKVYDFVDKDLGKASPYGIYDLAKNEGFVNVGISADTAAFAVNSIRKWWIEMGKELYPSSTKLYINADGGGSNSSRGRLWKSELQRFSTETGLTISVSHFPPGTSKWNKTVRRCDRTSFVFLYFKKLAW